MLRQLIVMMVAALGLAASIAACAEKPTPLPQNATYRTAPDAGPGACTPPPGTGTCQ